MESLERSNAVIDLGKRLVAQLKLGNDETAQWMAHVLAERIHNAENADPKGKAEAQSSCVELVFQLWERRYSLPHQLRPLNKLEPLLRTLDSLDTSSGQRFRFMQELPTDVKVDEDVEAMLDIAVKVDGVARILVHYYLAKAAEQATEEAKPWIQSATDTGADVALEVRVLGFVDGGLDHSSGQAKVAREILTNKIQELEIFASLAAIHATDLRKKHDQLKDEADDSKQQDE